MAWSLHYPWHNGHTSMHHQHSGQGVLVPANYFDAENVLAKADEPVHATNEGMMAPGKSKTLAQVAVPFGTVDRANPSTLRHYPLGAQHVPAVNAMLAHHGYTPYLMGGRHGKADLANRNFDTGHIAIWDPSPESGGGHGDEGYTTAHRLSHELGHALTKPDLNAKYGEGRRMGAMGKHISLREALRAVEWEHRTVHKQRDLLRDIGVHVNDDAFNRELNTVMADAVHRAITGKFLDMQAEGFRPHGNHVPLDVSLNMLRTAAQEKGLKDEHHIQKAESPMIKAETDHSHFLKPEYRQKGYSMHFHPDRGAELFQTGAGRVVHAFYNPKIGAVETRGFPNHHKWVGASTIKAMEDLVMAHARPDLAPANGLAKSLQEICPPASSPNLPIQEPRSQMSDQITRKDVIEALKKSLLTAVARHEGAIAAAQAREAAGQEKLSKAWRAGGPQPKTGSLAQNKPNEPANPSPATEKAPVATDPDKPHVKFGKAEQKPEDKRECPECHAKVGVTKEGALKPHDDCKGGGIERGIVKAEPTPVATVNKELGGYKSLASNPTAMPHGAAAVKKPLTKADMSDPSLCKAFGCGTDMHKCGDISPGKTMKNEALGYGSAGDSMDGTSSMNMSEMEKAAQESECPKCGSAVVRSSGGNFSCSHCGSKETKNPKDNERARNAKDDPERWPRKAEMEKVTPPDISEKTAHKIKNEYKGDKAAAYATMWSIHNKRKSGGKLAKDEESFAKEYLYDGVAEEHAVKGAKLPDGAGKKIEAKGSGDVTKETDGPDVTKGKKLGKADVWDPTEGDEKPKAPVAGKKSPKDIRGVTAEKMTGPVKPLTKGLALMTGGTPAGQRVKLPGLTPSLPKGAVPGAHPDTNASLAGLPRGGKPVLGGPAPARAAGTPPPIPAAAKTGGFKLPMHKGELKKAALPGAPKAPTMPAAPKPATPAATTTSVPTFKNKGAAPASAAAPGKPKA